MSVHPTRTPATTGSAKSISRATFYSHHKHENYIGTHQFPPSQCKLSNYYNFMFMMIGLQRLTWIL